VKKNFLKWLLFILITAVLQFLYIDAFYLEPNWIKIEKVKIVNPKLAKSLSDIKIIQISDLHIKELGFREISLIEKINRLKPDIILITGDLIYERQYINNLWKFLKLLEPKFHTYAIFGESDGAIADLKDSPHWDKANTYLLDGKFIRLNLKGKDNSFFWLIALSDDELEKNISNISPDEPIILLSHRPNIIKKIALLSKIDLVLAGHTHGGQVGIPFLYRFFPYAKRSEYISGLYKVKNTLLYVNRGITSEKGIRFLCRPEITLFEFDSKGKMNYRILKQDR
jgi:predicted MPP superfamily phosphohydrolase